MLSQAADNYLALRRACGFELRSSGYFLRSFVAFSGTKGHAHVGAATAVEWAGLGPSINQRARRLGTVIRFSRYLRAEDPRHELPRAVYGSEYSPRPVPYILSCEDVQRLVAYLSQCGQCTL